MNRPQIFHYDDDDQEDFHHCLHIPLFASLDYQGGTDTFSNLAPREAKYYKITIPANRPSWELLLQTSVGESELVVRRDFVADFDATQGGDIYTGSQEIEMDKLGPERYVLFPPLGARTIPAGITMWKSPALAKIHPETPSERAQAAELSPASGHC